MAALLHRHSKSNTHRIRAVAVQVEEAVVVEIVNRLPQHRFPFRLHHRAQRALACPLQCQASAAAAAVVVQVAAVQVETVAAAVQLCR